MLLRYGQSMLEGMKERCMYTFEMSIDCWVMEEPVRMVKEGAQEEVASSKKTGASNGGVSGFVSPRVTDH